MGSVSSAFPFYSPLQHLSRAVPLPRPLTPMTPTTVLPRPPVHVVVSDALRNPDPLIRALRDALAKQTFEHYGRLRTHDASLPDVSIHRDSVPRALRLVDAVVKSARKLGLDFRVHDKHGKASLHIVVGDEPVRFGIREKVRQERVPPDNGAARWDTGRLVYHPTGQLSVGAGHDYSTGFKRIWRDTTKVRVEDRLGEFLAGVYSEASRQQSEREHARVARIEREREAEVARAVVRERAAEGERRLALESQANDLDKAHRVAALVDEVERRAALAEMSGEEAAALDAWVQWAREHVGRLDPLARGLPPWAAPILESPPPWRAR